MFFGSLQLLSVLVKEDPLYGSPIKVTDSSSLKNLGTMCLVHLFCFWYYYAGSLGFSKEQQSLIQVLSSITFLFDVQGVTMSRPKKCSFLAGKSGRDFQTYGGE